MKYTIDRFEGDVAVVELENREIINVPRKAVPLEAKEGDIIVVVVDTQETVARKKKIQDLMKDLWTD